MNDSSQTAAVEELSATVELMHEDCLGSVEVSADRYACFDARMSHAIDALVQRWSHKAAPATIRNSWQTLGQRRS